VGAVTNDRTMSLLPLACAVACCLAFSCLVFFLRDQARRPSRATAPAGAGEAPRPD